MFTLGVSRGRIRIVTVSCPEVGLEDFLLGVQRSDYNFHCWVSRGRIRISIFRCPEVALEFSRLGVQRSRRSARIAFASVSRSVRVLFAIVPKSNREFLIRPLDTKGVTRISMSCFLEIPKPTSGHPKLPPEFPCSFFFWSS